MSAIFKKHLSRRTFIRGVGVTMSLPLLDAMVPAQTPLAQTAAKPQVRLGPLLHPARRGDEPVDAGRRPARWSSRRSCRRSRRTRIRSSSSATWRTRWPDRRARATTAATTRAARRCS